jgi:hypothetical protein
MCLTLKMQTETTSCLTLPPTESQTLWAVCETLLPALPPEEGDDPELFALSAGRLNVAGAMEQMLREFDPTQQQQLRALLRLLERPIFIAFLVRKLKGFSRLTQDDRMRVLQRLAVCRLEKLRIGFQAMKRLALFIFYS